MEYIRLGGTGLKVSKLVLGCMSFGVPERGITRRPWENSWKVGPCPRRAGYWNQLLRHGQCLFRWYQVEIVGSCSTR